MEAPTEVVEALLASSVKDVALSLQLPETTLKSWIDKGTVDSYSLSGMRMVVLNRKLERRATAYHQKKRETERAEGLRHRSSERLQEIAEAVLASLE